MLKAKILGLNAARLLCVIPQPPLDWSGSLDDYARLSDAHDDDQDAGAAPDGDAGTDG